MSGDYSADEPLVLCRGNRLARTLRASAARQQWQAGRAAWTTPAIFAFDTYLRRAWSRFGAFASGRRLLSDAEARYLFQRVVADTAPPELAATARQTADALLDTFRLATNWCLESTELRRTAFTADERLLARAASEYRQLLDANAWYDPAMLLTALLEHGWPDSELPACGVELAGFLTLTPAQERLFAYWRERGCDVCERVVPPPAADVTLLRPDDDAAELLAAGDWARTQLEQRPDAAIGIVVPGLARDSEFATAMIGDGLEPAWQLKPDTVDWHVSFGRALTDYPLLAAWLRPLESRGEPMQFADLSALLRDAQLLPDTALAELAVVERRLRDWPERHWRIADVLAFWEAGSAGRAALDVLAAVEAALTEAPPSASPRSWATRFADQIAAIQGLHPGAETSARYQLTNAFRDSLNALASLDGVETRMSLAAALAAWRRVLSATVFQLEDTGARVNILGPLEAVGHRYDALWVARLDDERWPPSVRANPYINRRLQADRAMPGADRERDQAFVDALLEHLVGCADRVVLSAPTRLDDVAVQPAPTLRRHWPDLVAAAAHSPPRFAASGDGTSVIARDQAVPMTPDDRASGGASLLTAALDSPFRAFAGFRLGATPLSPPVRGLGYLNRGNALHRAAELYYRPTLVDASPPEPAEAAAAALQRYRGHGDRVLHRLLDLEEARCAAVLAALVEYDRQRPAFEIRGLEQKEALRLGELTLNLRIDRLDDVAGQRVLIDYKTGALPTTGLGTATQLPRELQLAVYALALRQRAAGQLPGVLATLRLHARGIQANGIAFASDLLPLQRPVVLSESPDAVLDAWEATLTAVAARLTAGDVAIDPDELREDDWFYWRALAGAGVA